MRCFVLAAPCRQWSVSAGRVWCLKYLYSLREIIRFWFLRLCLPVRTACPLLRALWLCWVSLLPRPPLVCCLLERVRRFRSKRNLEGVGSLGSPGVPLGGGSGCFDPDCEFCVHGSGGVVVRVFTCVHFALRGVCPPNWLCCFALFVCLIFILVPDLVLRCGRLCVGLPPSQTSGVLCRKLRLRRSVTSCRCLTVGVVKLAEVSA